MEVNGIRENEVSKNSPNLIEGKDYTLNELSNGGVEIIYHNKEAQQAFNCDLKKIIETFININQSKAERP